MSIDVRSAIQIAKDHLRTVFGDDGGASPTLEEVWLDDSKGVWNITLGIRQGRYPVPGLETILRQRSNLEVMNREYKVVQVSAETGEPIAIRMRDAAA